MNIYERERRFRRFDPHSLPKENTTIIIGTGNKWDSPIYFFDTDGLPLFGIYKIRSCLYIWFNKFLTKIKQCEIIGGIVIN